MNHPEHPVIGDKAVRTNSRHEAQLPVTTPHTRMPQTAFYSQSNTNHNLKIIIKNATR